MTILNLMLGRKRGGLEQAALDYAEALRHAKIPALTVIAPGAWVEAPLTLAGIAHESLANMGYWDLFAACRLRRLAEKTDARAVICHGNRALGLALRALKGRVPVIAVAHNHATHRFPRADHCFAITRHLKEFLEAAGVQRVSLIPNMVRLPSLPLRPPYRTPPVIGSMGRLDSKKGFDVYINALTILKSRGIAFHALLGGEGAQDEALRTLAKNSGLEQDLTFAGWIRDKTAFFDSIDLFVLPSRHEAFGIALIEAMAYGVPVVTSDAQGPREIVRHGVQALVVPRDDAQAMADAIAQLLADAPYAASLARAARQRVEQEYTLEAMAARLQRALAPYISSHG